MNWIDIKKELPKYYEAVLICYHYKGNDYGKCVCVGYPLEMMKIIFGQLRSLIQ